MKKILPLTILLFAFAASEGFSQLKRSFAITGDQFGSVNWIAFREINTDGPGKTVYIPSENEEILYDALNGRKFTSNNAVAAQSATPQTCGCINKRMVAAAAYDAKNNRLYYTQMAGNQLRYLDLGGTQPKPYAVTTQLLKSFADAPGEASVITRMCIASDNFGYALTNDNQHLIKFSTGKKVTITDLGSLIDAKSNGTNSIKTQFTSWGGDMIADASGNLYLFAMQRGIWKINPNTKLATFIGQIKNMPEEYTINAAMVEDSENVIVGSSTKTNTYYRVDLNTLEAVAIVSKSQQVYNVSDFANGNFAFDKKDKQDAVASTIANAGVTIYPNPVTGKKLNILFSKQPQGKYVIRISELEGKTVIQKDVIISGSQSESVMASALSAGTYLINILNQKGESVYSNKIIVGK